MDRVKVFEGSDAAAVEEKVNKWLLERGGKIAITRVLQSSATSGTRHSMSSDIFITIFYQILNPSEA